MHSARPLQGKEGKDAEILNHVSDKGEQFWHCGVQRTTPTAAEQHSCDAGLVTSAAGTCGLLRRRARTGEQSSGMGNADTGCTAEVAEQKARSGGAGQAPAEGTDL